MASIPAIGASSMADDVSNAEADSDAGSVGIPAPVLHEKVRARRSRKSKTAESAAAEQQEVAPAASIAQEELESKLASPVEPVFQRPDPVPQAISEEESPRKRRKEPAEPAGVNWGWQTRGTLAGRI